MHSKMLTFDTAIMPISADAYPFEALARDGELLTRTILLQKDLKLAASRFYGASSWVRHQVPKPLLRLLALPALLETAREECVAALRTKGRVAQTLEGQLRSEVGQVLADMTVFMGEARPELSKRIWRATALSLREFLGGSP